MTVNGSNSALSAFTCTPTSQPRPRPGIPGGATAPDESLAIAGNSELDDPRASVVRIDLVHSSTYIADDAGPGLTATRRVDLLHAMHAGFV